MNMKRVFTAGGAVFVAMIILEFLIQKLLLAEPYEALADDGIIRSSSQIMSYMWVFLVIGIVYSLIFAYIFAKGYEGKGILEGVRFGIYIGLFWSFVSSFNMFVLFPIPYSLTWFWIVTGMGKSIIYGVIASMVYRPIPA